MPSRALIIRNAEVISLDPSHDHPTRATTTDLLIRDGRIAAMGDLAATDALAGSVNSEDGSSENGGSEFDASGLIALPGFVQGHLHYCQTLFRGLADDLPLMGWLQQRIWPLEAAHDAASMRVSAQLSVAELLRGGTTTVQVMESVRHTEATLEVARDSGMTTILGNCLMDVEGPGVPRDWVTTTAVAMAMATELRDAVAATTTTAAPLHYAISPRFLLSCSEELSRNAADFAAASGLRIHTHAGEHRDEIELVRRRTGTDYILALERQGLLTNRTTLAHCVHTTSAERDAIVSSGTAIAHCPSTNLKLGSGLAPIADYRARGIPVTLGADGAPCNNRLSALTELRQAALLAATQAGPGAFSARAALHAATLGGAEALGLAAEVGSLRVGKRADVVLLRPSSPAMLPAGDAVSRIVFAAETADILHVLVGGVWRVRDGQLTALDHGSIAAEATRQLPALLSRAGLAR